MLFFVWAGATALSVPAALLFEQDLHDRNDLMFQMWFQVTLSSGAGLAGTILGVISMAARSRLGLTLWCVAVVVMFWPLSGLWADRFGTVSSLLMIALLASPALLGAYLGRSWLAPRLLGRQRCRTR